MKLWDKGIATNAAIEQFTVGKDRELDVQLAPYDIKGTMAHVQMLEAVGLLNANEKTELHAALSSLLDETKQPDFKIPLGFEDIHSYVEFRLTEQLGEVGKKVHTGRSRNDQVLVDLHLFFRDQLLELKNQVAELFDLLQELSEHHKGELLPGYTHLQVAMPSSFGMWFGAFAECLIEDVRMIGTAYDIVNQNPLGSAAGYGTSFPLDRQFTTELLGFADLKYNAVAAQLSRGNSERFIGWALSAVASTVGRLAMDCCLYMSQNFDFISFPDHLTTGSSIMPHKKNPDVLELVRAKCNKLQALPTSITAITTNLPSGYHRDFQLLKEQILPAFTDLSDCLSMVQLMLSNIKINPVSMQDEKYKYLFTVEEVNQLVMDGIPFRDAYKIVGQKVEEGTFEPSTAVNHSHAGSIGNLCTEEIKDKMAKVLEQFFAPGELNKLWI